MDVSMKTGLSQNRACFDWKERNREWTVSVFRVIFLIALAFVYAACGKPPSGSGASLTIHYYRYAGDYENWNLWVWPAGGEGTGYVFDEPDDEGFVSSRITKAEAGKEYGMIVRRSEPGNDWAEKDVADDRFTGADEVWLVEGDPAVYTEKPDSPQPSFTFAVADSADTVTVTLPLPTEDFSVFAVYENGEKQAGSAVKGKTSRKVVITLEKPITDPAKQYTVRDASGFYKDKNVTMRNILDDFYYAGDDLGLTYRPEESVFKVWSPVAASVSVALFDNSYDNNNNNDSANDDTSNRNNARMYKMERDISSGVWTGHIREDLRGRYYLYYVAFSDGTTRWAADPYARAVSANGTRMAVVNLEETNPPGWNAVKKPPFSEPQDAVIYELHVRDFSMDENSGIRQQGKFLAFTETGTKSRENNATGLDYLTSLGVTHVHLLPVFDFASINELTVDDPSSQNPKFNWGYDPQNYNVPEGSYSTDPGNPPVRIAEFKRMVQSLQTAGIRVVMDVVYNHTYRTGGNPFDALVDGYFYRTTDNGALSDGSACGNETASERPMVRKFIIDSVRYWAREYRIDGFRFDLMGLHDIDTMNAIRKELDTIDPSIIIYGEGWTAAGSPLPRALQALKENAPLLDERIAVFSDDIRDGIRGSVFSAKETGFVTGGMTAGTADPGKLPDFRVEDVKFGIAGGTEHPQIDLTRVSYSNTFWAKTPGQTITYASAHDNLTLWDKLAATNPGADDETLLTLNKLAAAIVLTSQGAVFFQAGEEMARTKGGNDNSYNAPDATNKLDWSRQSRFASLTDYYCGLITLRKTYDAFRLRSADEVRTRLKFLSDTATAPDVPLIACTLETAAADYPRFTLLFNGSADTQTAAIPPGNWAILVNGDQAGTTPLGHISGGQVTVPGKTALILGETR